MVGVGFDQGEARGSVAGSHGLGPRAGKYVRSVSFPGPCHAAFRSRCARPKPRDTPPPPAAPTPRAGARVATNCQGPETRAGRGRGLAAGPAAYWMLVAGAGCGRQSPDASAGQVGSGRRAHEGPSQAKRASSGT